MGSSYTAGQLFQLFRDGTQMTRSQVCAATGLSRTAASERLDELRSLALIAPVKEAPSTGGRRAALFAFAPTALAVAGAAPAGDGARVGVYDVGGSCLGWAEVGGDEGPSTLVETARSVASQGAVHLLGLGLIAHGGGELSSGAHHGLTVRAYGRTEASAIAQAQRFGSDRRVLYCAVGRTTACTLVAERHVLWSTDDLGHAPLAGESGVECSCGSTSCLKGLASNLQSAGPGGRGTALSRQIGRSLGSGLTALVSFLEPDVVVIDVAGSNGEDLLAGVRGWLYSHVHTSVAGTLSITRGVAVDGGLANAAAAAFIDEALTASSIDGRLQRRHDHREARPTPKNPCRQSLTFAVDGVRTPQINRR